MNENKSNKTKASVAIIITAVLIAVIIGANVLLSALSDNYHLEIDMTKDKVTTLSDDNIDYIKSFKEPIEIIICSTRENYANCMALTALNFNINDSVFNQFDETETKASRSYFDYYEQTLSLIDEYAAYNKNITVKYISFDSLEAMTLLENYRNESNLTEGSIIVSNTKNNRYKILNYWDIYSLDADAYSYGSYTFNGNNLETVLTKAISYVSSDKKIGIVSGHSKEDVTEYYREMLTLNNYEVLDISDTVLKSIPDEVDAIVIAAPTTDFTEEELLVIEEFLNNGWKLSKGLIFFADVTAPYLEGLYGMLEKWGIVASEGVLFETNEELHLTDDPMTMYSMPLEENNITTKLTSFCVSGNNVPLTVGKTSDTSIISESIISTYDTVVAVPKGTSASSTDYEGYTKKAYSTLIQAVKSQTNSENKQLSSYIMAFSSIDFIYSDYALSSMVDNLNLTLYATEAAVEVEDADIQFGLKTISTSGNFKATDKTVNNIKLLFKWILPIACLTLAVIIYLKRRTS